MTAAVDLYILGGGGHGRELHSYIQDLERAGWNGRLRGYLDDNLPAGTHGRIEVAGSIDGFDVLSSGLGAPRYLTACGSNALRRKIVERVAALYGDTFLPWTLLHPRTEIGEDIEIGEGTCVAPGVIITAKTQIGKHCILNVKVSVSHDCVIGDFVNLNPGATVCGSVTIGEGAYIGAGAVVKERISIGAWSIIGAGAAVVRDIPPNVTAVGVPARIIKHS